MSAITLSRIIAEKLGFQEIFRDGSAVDFNKGMGLPGAVVVNHELKVPPGNQLEHLKGDRANQYSIRINQQYRICFSWEESYAYEIEITDYH